MSKDRGGSPPRGLGDTMRDILDDAPEAARGAIDTAGDLYRRGAMAVTRTAGDNGALMLLAGGVAVAAMSWLVLGRRKRKRGE